MLPRLLALSLAFLAPGIAAADTAASATTADPGAALKSLFADEWERQLRDSPETATYQGDHRFDDRWTDMSLAAIAAREAADRDALRRLRAIPRDKLDAARQLDYDTFEWQISHAIERQQYREWLTPVDQKSGPQVADGIIETMSFGSAADYRRYLARLAALPALIAQTTTLMREGLAAGRMPPQVLLAQVPAQIAGHVVADAAQSPFWRPLRELPPAIAAAEADTLRAEARRLIADAVVPAYRAFAGFFADEYLPRARPTIAASDHPAGRAYYDFLARYFTSTPLTADEIHAIGLQEVDRIEAAMEKLKAEIGFKGSLQEFFVHLRSDPRFFHKTQPALLDAYRALSKRIDPELVRIARTIPRLPYGVKPIPETIAPTATAAWYQGGAADGTRPGYYYVNLHEPMSRPTWEMMALSLHEAVPGHHFQFARALEMEDAPMFRKTAYFVAYGEGWALYAEKLGYDMGLYDDPYDRFGQLVYEIWRAIRLVVDTGMHAKGWTRQQAIDFFKAHAAKTELDIVNEIDRYIAWPGQALAYKIGELRIIALREKAQRELGARFDLRDFNDALLATGSVPLTTLEAHMHAWIAARR